MCPQYAGVSLEVDSNPPKQVYTIDESILSRGLFYNVNSQIIPNSSVTIVALQK